MVGNALPRTRRLLVWVSGLPCSGNHITKSLIWRAGNHGDSKTHCTVKIWHGKLEHDHALMQTHETKIVIPIRNEVDRWRSMQRRKMNTTAYPVVETRDNVRDFANRFGLPIFAFRYEDMMAYTDELYRDLLAWLGLPWIPLPTGEGCIEDAGKKYPQFPIWKHNEDPKPEGGQLPRA